MNHTIETLNNHVSVRNYTDEPIADTLLRTMLNAARRSPTSSNMQAYSFVVVRNPETKKKLAALAGNQKHIETCPVFVAICADISRLQLACEMHNTSLARNTENTMVATVDAAIVGMSLANNAEAVGLGTVMIGGMRNYPAEAAELLGLPAGSFVVYGLCMGWPAETPSQKPRMAEEAIIHYECYDNSRMEEHIRAYDATLAEHYRRQGRTTPDAAWSGIIAERFSQPRRPFLKEVLGKLGFSLD